MAKFYILQIEKVNTLSILANKGIHNFRKTPNAAPNADVNRRHLNEILINPGNEDYASLWKDRQYEVKMSGGVCKPKRGAVYAYEIVLGFSNGAIEQDKIHEWADANIEWLAKTFGGKENILSVVLHMDERTPHLHAIVIPIDKRNRLCARTFTGGRQKMFNLRDTYTEAMAEFGLEPPYRYTKATNKGVKKFYSVLNSIEKIEAPKKKDNETDIDYAGRCEDWVKDIQYRNLDTVNNLKKGIARLLAKQEEYNVENKDAHHLTNILVKKYCGNKKRAKKIILEFSNFVDNVPIETLETTLDFVTNKFAHNENVLGMDISKDLEILDEELDNEYKE